MLTLGQPPLALIFLIQVSDSLHKLNRAEQVILFRLRTGHNRLNAYMYSKFKVGESEMCPCNADIMTAEHLLLHCQLHDALRRVIWPEPVPLRDAFNDNLEELRRTAAFDEDDRHLRLAYYDEEAEGRRAVGVPMLKSLVGLDQEKKKKKTRVKWDSVCLSRGGCLTL